MASKKKLLQAAAGGATDVGWDINYLYRDEPVTYDWAKAYKRRNYGLSATNDVAEGVFFKPDSSMMFVVNQSGQEVFTYELNISSYPAWELNQYVYSSAKSYNASHDVFGIYIRESDGLKMYLLDNGVTGLHEYDLSTAWDPSTATLNQSVNVFSQEPSAEDLWFKPDGTKLYIVGKSDDEVNEFDLSTAWDISTISHVQAYSISAQSTLPSGINFSSDGTKMFISDDQGNGVDRYTLSTAWDISTASHDGFTLTSSEGTLTTGLYVPSDGIRFFITDEGTNRVAEYTISGYDVRVHEQYPYGVDFSTDGTKMFVVGPGNGVHRFDVSTAWDLSTASHVQTRSITEDGTPSDVRFKPDGTQMYVLGASSDDISYYTLSTPWDLSTETFVDDFSIASQDTSPEGLWFKPDGTAFYIIGRSTDFVYQYTLTTAWDMSTASYASKSADVSPPSSNPRGLAFKPDGTIFLTHDNDGNIYEYEMTTPWDVSTATRNTSKSFKTAVQNPYGLFVNEDGDKLFVTSSSVGKISSFTIGEQ